MSLTSSYSAAALIYRYKQQIKKKGIKLMDQLEQTTELQDNYEEVLEYFGDDISEVNDNFENYRKNIVTIIAYLIGVADEKFTGEDRFDLDEYEKLKTNENATVIRYLCKLRTQF